MQPVPQGGGLAAANGAAPAAPQQQRRFVTFEVVWAKFKQSPWWPAQVREPGPDQLKVKHSAGDVFVGTCGRPAPRGKRVHPTKAPRRSPLQPDCLLQQVGASDRQPSSAWRSSHATARDRSRAWGGGRGAEERKVFATCTPRQSSIRLCLKSR